MIPTSNILKTGSGLCISKVTSNPKIAFYVTACPWFPNNSLLLGFTTRYNFVFLVPLPQPLADSSGMWKHHIYSHAAVNVYEKISWFLFTPHLWRFHSLIRQASSSEIHPEDTLLLGRAHSFWDISLLSFVSLTNTKCMPSTLIVIIMVEE